MRVGDVWYRAVWIEGSTVCMIQQNKLPFEFEVFRCKSYHDTCIAIKDMITRGAGSIGVAAAFAMAQAIEQAPKENFDSFIIKARAEIESTRPTAQNLFYATKRIINALQYGKETAIAEAQKVADECAEEGRMIGEYGKEIIKPNMKILTHCNAGWIALQDYGSALSPIYAAFEQNKNPFVWVDETRPRGQGARLTAWELNQHGVEHSIIPDNAAAYLMQKGDVDIIITGADRIAANGDTANKIGTLDRAVLAKYYGIPFYIAAPLSTFDVNIPNGNSIPIEFRSEDEVLLQKGKDKKGNWHEIFVANPESNVYNPAFDVTPASLISGIITNKGIIDADENTILNLLAEK